MPRGLNRTGDFRSGTPITLPHEFGNPVTLPKDFGNDMTQGNAPTQFGNAVTWAPDPAHFGNTIAPANDYLVQADGTSHILLADTTGAIILS